MNSSPSRAKRDHDAHRALHGPIQGFRKIPTEFRPKVGSVCVRAIARIDGALSCDVARKKLRHVHSARVACALRHGERHCKNLF
jgi:hypothetical protein